MAGSGVSFMEVDADRWDDLALLFEGRGGPKSCWCMVWRANRAGAGRKVGETRKAALHMRVARGEPVGILGYEGGAPVAWCSIAPRPTYRNLGGVADPGEDPASVWSLVCFYIKRGHRGKGATDQLLQAAISHARLRGARIVEAYPVDPQSPSYRFMGFTSVFERAGFEKVATAGTRRHVMRLKIANNV